jgi:hypothetical protein
MRGSRVDHVPVRTPVPPLGGGRRLAVTVTRDVLAGGQRGP